ncbi:MAG: glycosyltransferase [Candidatus Omnitrophota bacterium]|nr:glycosyltransferase [Candidatus Omnitrophota bacterium]
MVFLSDKLENENIICVSSSDWEKPYGSKQQVMSVLASGNRILYIEAQVSFLHLFLDPFEGAKRLMRAAGGLAKKGSIYIYTPPPLLPFSNYFLFINRINQGLLLYCLKKLVKKLNFKRPILWVYCAGSAELLGKLEEKLSVYYCLDDFSSEIPNERRKKVMQSLERKLLTDSDIAFACTYSLCEQRKGICPDIHFVRNGVDAGSFAVKIGPGKGPEDIRRIPSPRIGLVGTFDSRIDTGLIFFIAGQKPQWQIILIGSNTPKGFDIRELNKHRNIHYLGFKKNELIAAYINQMDICIIPYHTHGFNRHLFPLKTWEYLAAGKPVVSTALPELDFLKDVIYIAADKNKFVAGIQELLSKGNDNFQAGIDIANSNSWAALAKEIARHITQKLNMEQWG